MKTPRAATGTDRRWRRGGRKGGNREYDRLLR